MNVGRCPRHDRVNYPVMRMITMSYASEHTHTSSGEIAISRHRYNRMRFSVIGLGLLFAFQSTHSCGALAAV